MAKTVLHKSQTRGHSNKGWLDSYHSFSFGEYYNRDRVRFGALRVLNDDLVAPGMGFDTHPHDNMEIISIPLEGVLEHMDSMNNISVIKERDIQIMSAGSGVLHSEYNKSDQKSVKFLQIWIIPKVRNTKPSYEQFSLPPIIENNILYEIVSPNLSDSGVKIKQDAWLSIGDFSPDSVINYTMHKKGNGAYIFMISGGALILDTSVNERDAIGVWEENSFDIQINSPSKILIIEVPMQIA